MRELNWSGVLFGSGAGLIVGLGLFAIVAAANAPTILQILVQLLAFVVAGAVAARLSLVGTVAAGGMSALLLYFGLAVVSVFAGNDVQPVAVVLFGGLALGFGSAGAVLMNAIRRRE
ncbi:MAG: hypothetical protein ACR2N7_01200 [Acidimicrobiia bacterium]